MSKYCFPVKICLIISIICGLTTLKTFSQNIEQIKIIKTDHSETEWFKEIQKEEVDFNKAKSLYDEFFNTHANEKSVQRNIAIRWFQVNSNNVDEKGKVITILPSGTETERLMKLNSAKNISKNKLRLAASPYPAWNDMTGSWRMIGPYHNKVVPCDNGYAMTGGFNDRVYINPYNTQNLFAGQSYGGLWVSKDQGATWKLTDAEFPNGKNTYANRDVYYGEIEVSKTNADLVFAATDAGVLKSTNGGENWTLVNDLNYITRGSERSYFVALANHDADMLLASYGKRIYRTTDGGSTWTVVFDNISGGSSYSQGQHSTTGVSSRKYNFAGLAFHPTANNIVYLAARNASNQLQIHISRDYGVTWALLVNSTRTQPFKMEVVPSAPDKIYLFELYTNLGVTQTRTGIIKYDTSGVKVQDLNYPVIGHLLDDCTVSETDSTVLYLGGYSSGEVHKSTDGGLTFFTNNPGFKNCDPGKYVHPDVRGIHAVGNTVLVASDGGNSLSTDGSATFQSIGQWISGIDLWGFSSAFKGDKLGSGDDHGPTEMRWFDGEGGWEHTGGADSKDITLNPAQPNWIYAMDVYRKFKMSTNEDSYGSQESVVDATSFKYLAFHPNIYGKAFPFKDKMLLVSENNMATVSDTLYTFAENITKVKIPLKNPSVFYVLVNKKKIFKSIDNGTTFSEITPSTTVTLGKTTITDIDVSNDGLSVWLSYGQVQNNCKVVKSTDGGANWVNYTTGLPSPTASNITIQRGTNDGVYVSTDGGGVWYRDNSMGIWSFLGNGLPMLGYVTSSYVVPDKKAFRMGTSRGAFEHELAFDTSPDALIAVDYNQGFSCTKDTVYFRDYSAYQGTVNNQFQWTFQGGSPATSTEMNPKVVYPNPGTFSVSLTVTDANGAFSTHQLYNFITIEPENCGIDTLRGKALVSTGQSQYLKAKSPLTSASNTFTLMAWVKMASNNPSTAGILSLKNASTSWHLNTGSVKGDSTQLGFHPYWSWNSGLYIKHNKWHHVALVVEPTKVSVVRDGIRATRVGSTSPILFDDFTIGTMQGAEYYRTFIGEIDEVAVYKRALTDEEIRKMMHLTKNNPKYPTQNDADLVAYYQFNENTIVKGVL
ncbi:MAG: LamG-like jellyroll fold domain-containing protein [Emticicia sp.]|nr:LamG-like jellyroll fold domain-containing protein [Emticicia sp.]